MPGTNEVAKSLAVLGIAWMVTAMMRRRSAAARHVVWTAAFAAVLALPVLTAALPALRMPVSQKLLVPAAIFHIDVLAARDASPASAATPAAPAPARPARPDWSLALMAVWAAGLAVGFAQMLAAWFSMWRIRRRASPLAAPDLAALAQSMGIRRPVDALENGEGSMPMTFGVLRPAVLMPADAAEWSPERRRVVLLHELAHVRRGDIATHLLARVALTLHWWNPLAWLAWRKFLKERERAADDLVLSLGARASDYAGHLLEIARVMQPAPALDWAAVAMVRRSQLEERLRAILDGTVNRSVPRQRTVLVAAAVAAAILGPLAALHAQNSDVDATVRAASSQGNPAILDNTAKAAESQQKYDVARKLLDSSLAIKQDKAGAGSVAYGTGLMKIADLERRRGNTAEAVAFYTKAAGVLGNRPEAAPAFIYLGINAAGRKDLDEAFADFQRAQIADPAQPGAALMWMAVTRSRQGNAQEAEALFRQALSLQDPKSLDAAATMGVFAQFLRKQNRADEAKAFEDQAAALRKTQTVPQVATALRVGGGVTPPGVVSRVDPQYSDEARAAMYQGTVLVTVVVGTDGYAHDIAVTRGLGLGLDQKAVDAIAQWQFQPGTKDGQPVPVIATIEVNFRLL